MFQAGAVERIADGRPGGRIRAVAGGLVADLGHFPVPLVTAEGDLSRAQDWRASGTCDVLASPRRDPQSAVQADDEGERLRQLVAAACCQPARELIG